jgi:uncharacterized membrane protein
LIYKKNKSWKQKKKEDYKQKISFFFALIIYFKQFLYLRHTVLQRKFTFEKRKKKIENIKLNINKCKSKIIEVKILEI